MVVVVTAVEVMAVEATVAVEDTGSISHHTVNINQTSSRDPATNKTTTSSSTINSNKSTHSRTTNSNSNSSLNNNMAQVLLTTSTTTTTRDTKQPQDTNRPAMHSSNSMARQHSNPNNRQPTRITRIIMQDTSSKQAMATMAVLATSSLDRVCWKDIHCT